MAMSLSEVFAKLSLPENSGKSVQMSLTIHTQKRNSEPMELYVHYVYYGFGLVRYKNTAPKIDPNAELQPVTSIYLSTVPGPFSVLNNVSYSTDLNWRGQWSPYMTFNQTFIVKEPVPESWDIRIDPGSQFPRPLAYKPRVTISIPERPEQPPWSVDLTEEDGFLRGIGAAPTAPAEKASYCIAFGGTYMDHP
jgi:hypothetical protein